MTNQQELEKVARSLVADHKGILAADESTGTITKRFEKEGIESNEETRRAYRDLLFTTPDISKYLNGVILYDETIRQDSLGGIPFPQLLSSLGILPGIKVDAGAKDLALFPSEKVTEGLDGLRERLVEYRTLGARFAKWRAVITIGEGIPTRYCLEANAAALARYAALCQEAGIVPIVEPEVLLDGSHSLERCAGVTETTLAVTFAALREAGVALEGMILKPNMVLPGKDSGLRASIDEVAHATVNCFLRTVPAAVPGIAFLSGGQEAIAATAHLNAMNSLYPDAPWAISFSFARALQDPAMAAWRGEADNIKTAQRAFLHRAQMSSAARAGTYNADLEQGTPTL